jgi:hypothetical protein
MFVVTALFIPGSLGLVRNTTQELIPVFSLQLKSGGNQFVCTDRSKLILKKCNNKKGGNGAFYTKK